jgi:serine protease AprX
MRILFTLLLFIIFPFSVHAQQKAAYLILFKDKSNSKYLISKPQDFLSERAISRRIKQNIQIRENDLPVNETYVEEVKKTGALIKYPTKWFNGIVVEATLEQLVAIQNLPFYKGIELNLPIGPTTTSQKLVSSATNTKIQTTPEDYGAMYEQMALLGIPELHQAGYAGRGMLIAVLDDGFANANQVEFYKHLFARNQIIDTYDFHNLSPDVYTSGSHGFEVLSTMAAYLPGKLAGAAYEANFALYTTENTRIEAPIEEVAWLAAAERADSLGADVISSSLGYNYFDGAFNSPAYNYTYNNMDGQTAIISKAARLASRKGILVVNAAGNEGNQAWKYIVAPADVDSVLSVGSVTRQFTYSSFSSIGPTSTGILKPDLSTIGTGAIVGKTNGNISSSSGTSFSTPQIAGMASILWQAYPSLTAQQIIGALKKSGSQYGQPDNLLGYGIPNVERAQKIIQKEYLILGVEDLNRHPIILAPNPIENEIQLKFPSVYTNQSVHITLISSGGMVIFNKEFKASELLTIPTPSIQTGIYFLKIKGINFNETIKFLK